MEKTDWQQLRSAASAIRTHALENLSGYLEEFERAARRPEAWCTGPGMRPRRGGSSLIFCARRRASEVIKIKTMTSAEIQLNPALEAAGHQRL